LNRRDIFKISLASLVGISLGYMGGRMSQPPPVDASFQTNNTTVATTTEKPSEKIQFAISDSKNFYHYHIGLTVKGLINRGHDVELSFLDVARGREAFATKRAQILTTSPIFLMSLAEQGEKVLLGPVSYVNLFVMVARKDFDEKNLSKPPNIGISILTSTGHYIATLFLKEHEITEVNWVQIGRSRERIAALMSGNLDISAIQYDEAFNAIESGADIKMLGDPKPFWVLLGLYEDWTKQNQEFVKDLIKTLILAKAYCRSDKDKHVNESIKYAELEQSPEISRLVRDTYEFYDRQGFWTTVNAPDSFYEELFQWSVDNKVIEGKVDFRSLNTYMKQLADAAYEEMLRA